MSSDKLTMTIESRCDDAEKLVEQWLTEHGFTMDNVEAFTINSAGRVVVYLNNGGIQSVGMVAAWEDEPEFSEEW